MSNGLLRVTKVWSAWLHAVGDLRPLAVFRMGWAAGMLVATAYDAQHYEFYTPEHYHAPLVAWATPLPPATFRAALRLASMACVMVFTGLVPRIAAGATVAVHAYLFASDLLLFRNHIYLGLLLGLPLIFSPCDRALAIDGWIRRAIGRPASTIGSLAGAQVIKAQVLIVYFWSVVNKLRASFLDGWTLQQELPYALAESPVSGWFHTASGAFRPIVARAIESDRFMSACSCAVVLTEAFLLLGLPRRRLRRYAIVTGLLLHGSILLLMNVVTFGLLMVSAYPLFLEQARRKTTDSAGSTHDQSEIDG